MHDGTSVQEALTKAERPTGFEYRVGLSNLAGAFAVAAARPAARPAHSVFEFLLCAANSAGSGFRLLGVFDPADELVAS